MADFLLHKNGVLGEREKGGAGGEGVRSLEAHEFKISFTSFPVLSI